MSRLQKKLTPEVMQQLRDKPGSMPLKIADVLWPGAVMRAQGTRTALTVRFFGTFSR
jgi:hypothetical protein